MLRSLACVACFLRAPLDETALIIGTRFPVRVLAGCFFSGSASAASHSAERVLGHSLRGVEGIYDRHNYRDEKAQALRQQVIEMILNPTLFHGEILLRVKRRPLLAHRCRWWRPRRLLG